MLGDVPCSVREGIKCVGLIQRIHLPPPMQCDYPISQRSLLVNLVSLNKMVPESILTLVGLVRDNAVILDDFFASNGLPSPSFGPEALPTRSILPPSSPPQVQNARTALISATRTLLDLVLGPAALLEDINVRSPKHHVWLSCVLKMFRQTMFCVCKSSIGTALLNVSATTR